MLRVFESVANILFIVAAVALVGLAGYLIAEACWEILRAFRAENPAQQILGSLGLIIISFAVMELSKFIVEEEIVRKRELRSAREARRSLTKFITIIIIALSLEALVMTFEANRRDARDVVYPAALFATAVFALIGLGVYQWLSNKVEPQNTSKPEKREPLASANE